jgi:nicotinamide mononucleotide transporter
MGVTSTLEVTANVVTTASILLAGRNSVHTWWTGIIGCALFTLLFYQSQLYADVVLQLFFVGTSALGWQQWLRGVRGQPLVVSNSSRSLLLGAILIGIAITVGYGALLYKFTDAYAPFVDSAVLVFSVIAQLMLMQRKRETWLFWIVVNSIAIPLYASRDLLLTSALYATYWVNALVSWFAWRRIVRTQTLRPDVVRAS